MQVVRFFLDRPSTNTNTSSHSHCCHLSLSCSSQHSRSNLAAAPAAALVACIQPLQVRQQRRLSPLASSLGPGSLLLLTTPLQMWGQYWRLMVRQM